MGRSPYGKKSLRHIRTLSTSIETVHHEVKRKEKKECFICFRGGVGEDTLKLRGDGRSQASGGIEKFCTGQ